MHRKGSKTLPWNCFWFRNNVESSFGVGFLSDISVSVVFSNGRNLLLWWNLWSADVGIRAPPPQKKKTYSGNGMFRPSILRFSGVVWILGVHFV